MSPTDAFSYGDHMVFTYLYKWALSRHPNKSKQWVAAKYFHDNYIPNKKAKEGFRIRKWTFATKLHGRLIDILAGHSDTKFETDEKPMAFYYSPYNTKFADRKARSLLLSFEKALFDRQHGVCYECSSPIIFDDLLEVHHLITDKNNLDRNRIGQIWLIHGHCHDKLHSRRDSQSVIEEEPYDA